jgi:hypothetical protein
LEGGKEMASNSSMSNNGEQKPDDVTSTSDQSSNELRIEQATEWVKTSKIEYDAYRKLVLLTWFPLIHRVPTNPQPAIMNLQRSVEKLIKAIAYASGQYTYDEILEKSHDSFGLFLDLHVKLVETPIAKLFLDNVQGQIFAQSNARFFDQNESLRRLIELKSKSKPGNARREMGEWAYELSTLPPKVVSQLVESQLRSLRTAKMGAVILNRVPFGLLAKRGHFSSKQLSSTILKSFEKQGFLLSDGVKNFFNSEQISSFFENQPEEKRLTAIKNLGNFMVSGATSNAMMILAALTFGHAIFPGYPANPEDAEKDLRKLESKSYEGPIGIAGSMLSVGKLVGAVLKQSTNEIKYYAEIYNFMNLNTSELFKQKEQ